MASSDREGLNPLYPGLVVVLVAALGALFSQFVPLETSRPRVSEPKDLAYKRQQNVAARLWQDPIDAVEKTDLKGLEPKPLSEVVVGVSEGNNHLDILGVLISGAPYPGASEGRRRGRYAVVSALHASGYIPHDAQNLGLAMTKSKSDKEISNRIPFEEYYSEKEVKDRVLVLWLNEDALGENPLSSLVGIFSPIMDSSHSGAERTIKLIGPELSSTLQRMMQEIQSASADALRGKTNSSSTI